MRICLDLRYKTKSGASSYIKNIVPEILKHDYKNQYIIIKYPYQAFDFEKYVKHILISPAKNDILQLIWDTFVLPIKFLTLKPDIYHPLKNVGPSWISAKKVYTMHSIINDYKGTFPTSPKRFLYDIFYTNPFIRHCTRLIAVSDFISDFLADSFHIRRKNIDIIYHGIDNNFKVLPPDSIKKVLKKYSIGKDYVLSVGNITPVKNFITTVKAFGELARDISSNLVIVGGKTDSYYDRVKKEIKKLNLHERVIMPGFISGDELVAIMNGAKVLIMPSLTEGCPVTMLEAFRCGLPVIASKRGGLWDLGKNCSLFVENPMDYLSFSGHLQKVLSSEKFRILLKKKSMERALDFTWDKAAKAHLKTYELAYACPKNH